MNTATSSYAGNFGPCIMLASNSASRKAMLRAAQIPFAATGAQINEREIEERLEMRDPAQVACALAQAKAQAVEPAWPQQIILGSDSLVVVEGRRFDKPATREDAARHLRFFSGKCMHLYSAAVLVRHQQPVWRHSASAQLYVRHLSDSFIESYLAEEWPAVAGCVGVFRIEAMGAQLFERLEGDYFTILGMPLLAVLQGLREHGVLAA